MLASPQARQNLLDTVARHGFGLAIDANLDPSHFFWMGMDGHKVAAALGERIGHAHGKDTVLHYGNLALNGLLDTRWPQPTDKMSWTFAVPGRGHGLGWWTELIATMTGPHAKVISIEHEGPFIPATTGVTEAAKLLRAAISETGGVDHRLTTMTRSLTVAV